MPRVVTSKGVAASQAPLGGDMHTLGSFIITNLNYFRMHVEKNEKKAMSLVVTDGLTVTILSNSNHEFLMSTREVSKGYGTTEYAIRQNKSTNPLEFIEGKHFVKGVSISHTQPHQVFWTKKGIVRLGFFIKSNRAKLFRDWAEELIINFEKQPTRQLPAKRNYYNNRLTHERLLDIMADVCRIDDKGLRIAISEKLMNGGQA